MNAGSETRLLVAAPAETRREAQVDWYEALLTPAAKSAHVLAFSREAVEVARLDAQLVVIDGLAWPWTTSRSA